MAERRKSLERVSVGHADAPSAGHQRGHRGPDEASRPVNRWRDFDSPVAKVKFVTLCHGCGEPLGARVTVIPGAGDYCSYDCYRDHRDAD